MKPQVSDTVQYFTTRTIDPLNRERRLDTPERIGPFAAIVLAVRCDGNVNLKVYQNQHEYFAYNVGTEPSTPVQHYWQFPAEDGE